MFWTASRVDYCIDFNKKFGICLYEHNYFTFFLSIICHSFVFLPVQEEKKSVFVAVRERLVFILSSFMVPICTILKVLILVYMQNIPVLQQKKHVTKIRIKKKWRHHTYIFWTLYRCFTMCFNLRSEKKPFEINALFIKQYETWVEIQLLTHLIRCMGRLFIVYKHLNPGLFKGEKGS